MAQDKKDVQIQGYREYIAKLKRQRLILMIPAVVLTFPISLPALAVLYIRRRRNKPEPAPPASPSITIVDHRYWVARSKERAAPTLPLMQTRDGSQDILIWCPIDDGGLTRRLERLTEILRADGLRYRISYRNRPKAAHPETINWIDPDQIRNPRVVFFIEKYTAFENGFLDSFHVCFADLDAHSATNTALAKIYADLVVTPTDYRLEELRAFYSNSRVLHLPWSVATGTDRPEPRPDPDTAPIRVLYVGYKYDENSRKNPYEVLAAILACTRSDLRFVLKFSARFPDEIRSRLEASDLVEEIYDHPVSPRQMRDLTAKADVSLAPNTSEGSGQAIDEILALGVVPAVLDGHPMKDAVGPDRAYFIACEKVDDKEFAPVYRTSEAGISAFLAALDRDGVRARQAAIAASQPERAKGDERFAETVRAILSMNGLLPPPDRTEVFGLPSPSELSPIARTPWFEPYLKQTRLIDVFMTTSKRADHFGPSLGALIEAVEASPYDHRITIVADGIDAETAAILERHRDRIFQVLWTGERQGLPYAWNTILDISSNMAARTERVPEFLCYIQDDCLIVRPDHYFEEMVAVAEAMEPAQLGFVSGFHTEIHAGYERAEVAGREVILSDSIDGKNFMARPKVLYAIGKLTWWFPNGERRGNPGPTRGSHFDLWQWSESPRSLQIQGRVSVVLPGLCDHIAESAEASTWNNDTSQEATAARVSEGRVYRTRS